MKLTNGEIMLAKEGIDTLTQMKFPVEVSYKLAKLASAVRDEHRAISGVKDGLVIKYGVVNEGGVTEVTPTNPRFPDFIREFNTLMEIETEIVATPVKLPLEVDGKPLEVEPRLLISLTKFIDV